MKALSIRQPWTWLIMQGHKDIENRTWNTNYRGPLLIHASSKRRGLDDPCFEEIEEISGIVVPSKGYQFGGIVGICELVDVIPPCRFPNIPRKWHQPDCFGFVLRNVKPLEFVPLKGKLRFFEVGLEVAPCSTSH